jgi:HlyD family secretion protein
MKNSSLLLLCILFFACKNKVEKTKATRQSISESIYASGTLKAKNQYQVMSTVSGIVENVFVSEGDTVSVGTPLIFISNEAQRYAKNTAQLNERFSDESNYQSKLMDAQLKVELAKKKYKNDSLIYERQKALWKNQVGSKIELEQRELAFHNALSAFNSAELNYTDLKKQLALNSALATNNLKISSKQENDFTVKSEINGKVYSILKSKGDLIVPQNPIAVIGDAEQFVLEMQVDESDIIKLKRDQLVLISMDSYKGAVFEARITKINPFMNERSKTFLIEAEFVNAPEVLYPNINFEANILVQTKKNALLIPRNFMVNDSMVLKSNGDTILVRTGLKDYNKTEILSGISDNDELIMPKE